MLDPLEVRAEGRDRAERAGIWISGIGHTVLVLWAIIGGIFVARDNPPPQLTEVATMSNAQFEEMAARSRGAGPVGQADGEAPVQPETPGDTSAPEGPDLALDLPRPDSSASVLAPPPGQPEPAPDLSDFENATPPVEVATLAPEPVPPAAGRDTPPAPPESDSLPQIAEPERPDLPPPPVSALALDRSNPPPERPDELREAVLAARQAAEAEAAAQAQAHAEAQAEAQARAAAEQAEREAAAQAEAEAQARAEEQAREQAAARAEAEQRAAEEARREEEARLAQEARRQEEARQAELARRLEEERRAEDARRAEAERRAEEQRRIEAERQAEEARLAREAEARAAEEARRAAAELARERDLAERLAEERRLQEQAALAQEATPSPVDGNAEAGEGEGGGSDVLTDALNEAGAAAIRADQLDDALADAMGQTRPSELPRDGQSEIATVPMTEAEKDGFKQAVQACWNLTPLSTEAAGMRVVVGFTMDRTGMPDPESFRMVGDDLEPDPNRQQAFEAARRAVLRCTNGGYQLPADKYNEWDDVEMTFSPEGVEGVN